MIRNKIKAKAYQKAYYQRPNIKAKIKEYQYIYRHRSDIKARRREARRKKDEYLQENNKNRMTKLCPICNRYLLIEDKRIYCSRKCLLKSQKISYSCINCGFITSASKFFILKRNRRFCSRKCSGQWNQKQRGHGKSIIKCKFCNNFFSANTVKRKMPTFCSRNCRVRYDKANGFYQRLWNDNDIILKRQAHIKRKPNIEESSLNYILQKYFPNQWKYVGDGKFWIEKRNPDFINSNGKKLIIEYDGSYWHKNKERDLLRTQIYSKHGYKMLSLNEIDLKKIESLLEKVKSFSERD
jgi:very-short-patch-repair endonuclease